MSYLRSLSATLLSAAMTFSLVTASGCGTGAMGVEDCREIQQARCRAGAACGIIDDVSGCERYYRDHCLHGLATTPPAGASVAACVDVIEAAGQCASTDPESRLRDCAGQVTDSLSGNTQACEIIKHPELAGECAFLNPDTAATGSGGEGGSSADGAGASAGADSTSGGDSAGGAPTQ